MQRPKQASSIRADPTRPAASLPRTQPWPQSVSLPVTAVRRRPGHPISWIRYWVATCDNDARRCHRLAAVLLLILTGCGCRLPTGRDHDAENGSMSISTSVCSNLPEDSRPDAKTVYLGKPAIDTLQRLLSARQFLGDLRHLPGATFPICNRSGSGPRSRRLHGRPDPRPAPHVG